MVGKHIERERDRIGEVAEVRGELSSKEQSEAGMSKRSKPAGPPHW